MIKLIPAIVLSMVLTSCAATTYKGVFVGNGAGVTNVVVDGENVQLNGAPIFNWDSGDPDGIGFGFAGNENNIFLLGSGDGLQLGGPLSFVYFPGKIGVGTNIPTTAIHTTGAILASNVLCEVPRWIDIPANYGFSVTGPSAPSLTAVRSGSVIQELAFDNGDILYAQAQFPHTLAVTNASFPKQYFEPHVHFSCNGAGLPDATHSNVTWRIEWELGDINGTYKLGTNSVTTMVAQNLKHYMAEFGHITNDPPMSISAVFRCRLMRPASATIDYSNNHDVLLDGFDLHVPVGNRTIIGSETESEP